MALAHLAAGMTLDGFRLEQRLHLGGMAAIWRVTHADIDTPIVLKAPFLDHKGNLSQLVGFEVEQKIMARVTGVHVPRFFANGDFTVQPYVVMEHIAGPTLLQLMAETAMPPDAVLARGLAMAEALADLHGQHVLHLDLKPANVLFRETGEAVIIDFGLSRHAELPDLFHEQYLKPAGTTAYMAPEQLLRIRSDVRSDIFALGAMLYHMATGVRPFGSPGTVERVRRRVWLDPPPPRKLQPGIPPELQEIILKCLEPLPGRRYASADELAFDLRRPELVELTARAGRIGRTGPGDTILRLLHSRTTMREIEASATKPPPRAPIILVSVDLRPGLDAQRAALLDAAVSVLANMPGARLACLDVKLTSLMPEANVDAGGRNIHVERMAQLRAWVAPLEMPEGMLTCHLVEARSVAAGVIAFARSNAVDHIVVGAGPGGGMGGAGGGAAGGLMEAMGGGFTVGGLMAAGTGGSGASSGKLAMQITAEAPCSVTVVREGG